MGPDVLMTGSATVIADHEARDVHRFEIREIKTCEAVKVVIVPASVGCTDQTSTRSIVSQDDPVVSKRGDDDRRLRTRRGAGGSRHRSFQSIDLARRTRHGAAGWRRCLRYLALRRDRAAPGSGAATHPSSLRRRPYPVVQDMIECEPDWVEDRAVG